MSRLAQHPRTPEGSGTPLQRVQPAASCSKWSWPRPGMRSTFHRRARAACSAACVRGAAGVSEVRFLVMPTIEHDSAHLARELLGAHVPLLHIHPPLLLALCNGLVAAQLRAQAQAQARAQLQLGR